ncbi:MAG: hypothetical protein JSS81_27585 [Acidobacteria bacterium]|nr:hypothetical protein [Acidobacteriota bacterium]
MNQKIITLLLALAAGMLGALVVCSYFFIYYKPARGAENKPVAGQETPAKPPEATPTPAPPEPGPTMDVKAEDVESAAIETNFKDFYPEGSKCRKNYNEMFGDKDGVSSPSSPCTITLTATRAGRIDKAIVIRRYDTVAKEWRSIDKTVWKARISAEQFDELVDKIVNNQAFKDWNNNVSLTVSNCKIMVKTAKGWKSPMSNVTGQENTYFQMVKAFKALDAKVAWEEDQ